MPAETFWEFRDDRGRTATAARRPERIVAYIQAAATLWDHGLRPVGHFGSQHDGDTPDPAKSGALALDEIRYLGAGGALRADEVLTVRPELLVAVTYDGERVYGLDGRTADELEARVPTVVFGVGPGRALNEVRDRFSALARSLGAEDGQAGGEAGKRLDEAADRLRSVAAGSPGRRVLALSPAGTDSVHLARPGAWPDLRALSELGVGMVEPPDGAGANWATVGWADAVSLGATVVLTDVRANAARPEEMKSAAWRVLEAEVTHVPWNPEVPCSALAHARFFDGVADALEAGAAGHP